MKNEFLEKTQNVLDRINPKSSQNDLQDALSDASVIYDVYHDDFNKHHAEQLSDDGFLIKLQEHGLCSLEDAMNSWEDYLDEDEDDGNKEDAEGDRQMIKTYDKMSEDYYAINPNPDGKVTYKQVKSILKDLIDEITPIEI